MTATRMHSDLRSWQDSQLAALNDHRYLAHKTREVAEFRAFAADWLGASYGTDASEAVRPELHHVEIGSNRGEFAMGMARTHTEQRILALEWRVKWVDLSDEERRAEGLENLRFLHADARIALPAMLAPGSVERLYVFYPDPWWKKRHLHRRLIDVPFLRFCGELLSPDGMLVLRTDARVVRDGVAEMLPEVPEVRSVPPLRWPDERGWTWTNRERQCMSRGIATYRLIIERADSPGRSSASS